MLISPIAGVLIALLQVLNAPSDYRLNRNQIVTFIVVISVWLSLINITKSITSDQGAYSFLFLKVPERGFYGTVFRAWGGTGKEPVYSFITWCLYWLTGGNLRLFFFAISLGIYLPVFFATYKLFKAINVSKGALICGILALAFFTQYFVLTVHLIRQMLASSIVIYAIAYHAVNGKNNWTLLIVASLIHTSAMLLAILSVVPWFYRRMNIKQICIVFACFIPLIVFNSVIAAKLGNTTKIDAINYGLERLGNNELNDGIEIPISLMIIVLGPLALVSFKLIWIEYSKHSSFPANQIPISGDPYDTETNIKPIIPIAWIYLLLMLFVLSFTKNPLIQYRFFYYTYSFVPLLLPLLFTKGHIAKLYWWSVSIFFIIRFFVLHNTSGFKYAQLFDLFTQPIFFYFTGNFHRLYNL